MSKLTKRLTAMLLAGMLLIGSVPGSVFAADVQADPGVDSRVAVEEVTEESVDVVSEDVEDTAVEDESADAAGKEPMDAEAEEEQEEASADVAAEETAVEQEDASWGDIEDQETDQTDAAPDTEEIEAAEKPEAESGDTEIVEEADAEQESVETEAAETARGSDDTKPESEEGSVEEDTASEANTDLETENEQETTPDQETVYTDVKNSSEESSEVAVEEKETQPELIESSEEEQTVSSDAANDVVASGTCGDNLTWTLDEEGILTISGTGYMESFYLSVAPWYDFKESISTVIIDENIESIGDNAFSGCNNLSKLVLGKDISRIGYYAFSDCTSLTHVSLPDRLKTIDTYAFKNCTQLLQVDMFDNVNSINNGAFYACSSLKTINISDSVYTIGDGAFLGCCSIEYFILPAGLKNVGFNVFAGCEALRFLFFKGTETEWNNINFDETVTQELASIPVHYGTLEHTTIEVGEVPASCTDEGKKSHYECVVCGAFFLDKEGLSELSRQDIIIPATGHTVVIDELIPPTDTEPGFSEGSHCSKCGAIIKEQEIIPAGSITGSCGENASWILDSTGNLTIRGSGKMTEWFIDNPPWYDIKEKIKTIHISSGITLIGANAFKECQNLETIEFSETIETIRSYAFRDCTNLLTVILPNNAGVEFNAFYNCTKLNCVVIPDGWVSFSDSPFKGCNNLEKIIIPKSVKTIQGTFQGFPLLKTIQYSGTKLNWSKIKFEEVNNRIAQQNIYCSDGVLCYEHEWDDGQIINLATCTEDGVIRYYCVSCGEQKEEIISANGHEWNVDYTVDKEETCIEDGIKSIHCKNCNEIKDSVIIPAAGHTFTDWTVIKEATINETGIMERSCSKCQEKEQTIIPQLISIAPVITLSSNLFVYNRHEQRPEVIVTDGESVIDKEYYDVNFTGDGIQVGTYNVIVTLKGKYTGVAEKSYRIIKPDYTIDKIALLREYIVENGSTNSAGNKLIQSINNTNENVVTTGIVYIYEENLFSLINITNDEDIIKIDIPEQGAETIEVTFISSIGINASATISPQDYTSSTEVLFKQKSPLVPDAYVQDICNAYLKVAMVSWDLLLLDNFGFDINMGDLGFTGFEEHGLHTWDEGVVTKKPSASEEGKITYICSICGKTKEEKIPSLISIGKASVTGLSAKIYTGKAITPMPTVKIGSTALTRNTDYTISYKNNTNAGTASLIITGKGKYTGTKTVTFTINKAAQSITAKSSASTISVGKNATVSITGAKGTMSYKSSNTAVATVTSAGKVTAKKVGTVKITATSAATSNYKAASKTVTIKVVPAATASLTATNQATGIKLTWKKVTGANGYKVYRGSTLIKTITSGSTVSFVDKKANTNGTKYTYKVVAKGTTGDSTLSRSRVIYRVARPAISSATNSTSKKMTVKWGKNAKATGYQIQYSTDKTFKTGNKAVTVAGASAVSKVIGSLTKNKTYYVRIRTYKTVGSAKYWSVWSAAKSVKIAN